MEILIGKRQQGKTTHLIKMSAAGEGTIITPTMQNAKYIKAQAKEMKLDIPDPICWNEFFHRGRGLKGPFLLDEVGGVLAALNIKVATLDDECVRELPNGEEGTVSDWAAKEVELAIAAEKAASPGTDEWKMGAICYESALRALRSLAHDGHSGFSIQMTKSILNRLVNGQPLTPIEDTDDIWIDITFNDGKRVFNDNKKHYQCKRMSSLFKEVAEDGTIVYTDGERVNAVNVDRPDTPYHNGFTTRLVDKIFPITMPYLPSSKKFKVVRDEFLVDPKNGDYDTVGYLYILTPDGKQIELNRYFKEIDGQMVQIEKAEFDERKANRVEKKRPTWKKKSKL